MTMLTYSIPNLHWFRCMMTLMPDKAACHKKAHPLSVLEAIIKGMTESAQLEKTLRPSFYWLQHRATTMHFMYQKPIVLQIDLFGADQHSAEHWANTAYHYFDLGQAGRNFTVHAIDIFNINTADLDLTAPSVSEICLDFVTPLPFKTTRGRNRLWLDQTEFNRCLTARLERLFNISVKLPDSALQVLPFYWDYRKIDHISNSQQGHIKYLNGCVNRLYLKAEPDVMAIWLPWLKLAEMIGLGKQISFGLGRFVLLLDSPAYFQADLINPTAIKKVIHSTLEECDDAVSALATHPAGVDEDVLAQQLATRIKTGWQSSPYQAFSLPKHNGGVRIVEKLELADKIIHRHLLALLNAVLDNAFSEESIGYRKGLSRQIAIERLNSALADGYDYVLESDIADFFPSVDLNLLQQQLNAILPERDQLLRQVLKTILETPRELAGQLQIRNKGLAIGSPLSPLLANLYLDAFDHKITALGVKLIRFADDFIILTKGQLAAEALLGVVNDSLQALGLHLNLEKTAIRPITDSFTFLGIRFGGNSATDLHPSPSEQLRKPVYITEPFTFIGVAENALEVRRGTELLTSIPLRRISEILSLAPCSWSSQLMSRAVAENIPLVLTTGYARHIATIMGNSAQHYQIAYRQTTKFHGMSEAAHLVLAQEFASGKLHNYISLIQQRYQAGTHHLIEDLNNTIDAMWAASHIDTVRGLEGAAARKTFAKLATWIESPDFQWHGRKRRPPDRINSLLNFGYHLLFCRINVLVRGAGLNPFLGFLHEPNEQYEALVCDIQELFRPSVDRFIVKLINLKIIKADDFIINEHGAWLNRAAKNRFLSEFSKELEHQPQQRNQTSLNQALMLQVNSVRDFFLHDQPIQLFTWHS